MRLLRFDRFEDLDFPKLMEIYRESNLENIPSFFPEETDPERGLRRVEAGFRDYLRNDFFSVPGNRSFVLSDGARWASAIRLFPVPAREPPGLPLPMPAQVQGLPQLLPAALPILSSVPPAPGSHCRSPRTTVFCLPFLLSSLSVICLPRAAVRGIYGCFLLPDA